MGEINNFEDLLKERDEIRDLRIKYYLGGIREEQKDFFYNELLLKKIYEKNKEHITSDSEVSDLMEYMSLIHPESESDRIASISANFDFNFNSLKIHLPENFSFHEEKTSMHPENANQLNITYSDNSLLRVKTDIISLGLYLLNKDKEKYFVLSGIQGEVKSVNLLMRNDGDFLDEKSSLKKIKGIFGRLNTFYGKDWRAGLVGELKNNSDEWGLKIIGKMPQIFTHITSSLDDYPLYSIFTFSSYVKGGIPLENIDFSDTPKMFIPHWNKILENKKKEKFDLESICKRYEEFKNEKKRLWLYEEGISLKEYERLCFSKFSELVLN